MTDQPVKWTRRQFSQLFAATAASSLLVRGAAASPVSRDEGFAFVGSSAADPMDGTVRVYRVSGANWREVHALQAASPAHMVMHPTMPVLYVVHDIAQWEYRPRGAVSAYRFDTTSGQLTHAGTQPLSLSATNPRHAVITADAQALLVAAESGGIYNLLPIAANGTLQPVSAIRKELGSQEGGSAKTSAPRQVMLHADGSVYAVDPGQETVSVFTTSSNAITLQQRNRMHQGAGASHLNLSNSSYVYALNAANGSISVHSITGEGLSPASQTFAGTGSTAAMQMHPEGRVLAVSNDYCLQVLRLHPRSGRLTRLESVRQTALQQLQFTASGTQLAGIQAASGEVVAHAFDTATGELTSPRILAQADGASSLLLHLS